MNAQEEWGAKVRRIHTPCAHPPGQVDYMGHCMSCGSSAMQIRQDRRDDAMTAAMNRLAEAAERLIAQMEKPKWLG